MAYLLRKTNPLATPVRDLVNAALKRTGAGSSFHMDKCERSIVSANASDLATSIVLANEIMAVYLFHLSDDLAHKIQDPPPALVAASDLATLQTLATAIKADYEVHRASTTYHYTADATNTISAANATDLGTSITLLNELKTDINAHLAGGPTDGQMVRLIDG